MHTQAFFLVLITILITARLFGEIVARLGAPAVIGELLAGIVLGPSLLGWVEPTHSLRLLSEIGIVLLLFEVGLETDVLRLVENGLQPFIVATAGFAIPFAFAYALSHYLFSQGRVASLFVGGTLTATSIGITMRMLADLRRNASDEAQVVLGAAVIDDALGVVLLAFLYQSTRSRHINLAAAGKLFLFVALFLVLAPIAARAIASIIERFNRVSQIPGLIPTTVVSLVLLCAWLASEVGAPQLLGGFVAGLALSRRFRWPFRVGARADAGFTAEVERAMRPIVHLFAPIFFVMVGLTMNLRAIDWSSPFVWTLALSLFAIAVAGKVAAGFLVRRPLLSRLAIGMAMVPRGEVGLIFVALGQSSGVLDGTLSAVLVIVIALSTLLPPFAMKWLYVRYAAQLPG
ncbi:MAG: cation:proton antiporter [Acidiferrobacterales bacterium]